MEDRSFVISTYVLSQKMQVLSISAPNMIGPGTVPASLTISDCRPRANGC